MTKKVAAVIGNVETSKYFTPETPYRLHLMLAKDKNGRYGGGETTFLSLDEMMQAYTNATQHGDTEIIQVYEYFEDGTVRWPLVDMAWGKEDRI
jgi:hypothetical protein